MPENNDHQFSHFYSLASAMRWLALWAMLSVFPLAVGFFAAPAARVFLLEFSAGLGLLGLGLMVVQGLFSGRFASIAPLFGADNIMLFHRQVGIITLVMLVLHPILMVLGDPSLLAVVDPRVDLLRALALWALMGALLAMLLSSVWRLQFGLSYEHWRLLHGLLASFLLMGGLGHVLMVGHLFDAVWKLVMLVGFVAAGLLLIVFSRLLRPWLSRRRPWKVVSVAPERGLAWTVTLRPEGHSGMAFRPGQYAWFSFGPHPWRLQQHPFSLLSEAGQREIQFTADVAGDFTASLEHLPPGTPAFVEGPLGSFSPHPNPGVALLLIAGGIGVTPMVSMIRSLRGQGDQRPITLIYASPSVEEAAHYPELHAMEKQDQLRLVPLIEKPPEGFDCETGRLDQDMVRRYLPPEPDRAQYMICGPDPLMDEAESSLRDLGVDWRRIYTERFQIV